MCNYRTVLVILTAYQLMTFTLGLVCGPEMTCDEGWIMSAGAPVCYLPVNVSMNWEFASLTCESVGASLVKVEDETENCEIRNSFEKFWIGLSRNVKDVNETVWNGREVVSDEDGIWDINQPDTNRNKLTCVAAKQNHLGRWSYEDCLTKLPFVCKKKSKLKGCFQCPNGDVIPPRLICDDENDCGDNSDEVNCIGKCRHLYTGLSGNISYNSYENRKTCHWKIVGPVGSTIKLTVVKGTVLEENADFVEIISASTTLPNRLTGRILHDSVIYSARNHMLKIILNSDDSQSGVFVAHWQAEDIVQNWELTTPAVGSEIISFYSLPYKQYEWIITAKDQNVVTLQFIILNVDKVSGSYWILFDGNQPVLPRNTGDIYISRSKSVKIVLVSYSVSNQLSITYSQGCKILLSFQQYTRISSPGFQEENNFGYPNGVYCEWDIYSLYNYSASIKFTDFNLKQDSDYLTIINSTTNFHPNRGFSGDGAITKTTVFRSTSGYFRLEFISDMALTADGFQAQYSIDCKLESSLSQWTQTEPKIEEYTPFGTEIMVTCMTGYQFKQEEFSFYPSVNIKCMAGGSWNVTRFPDCQITYCGVPPAIDYGYIVSSTGVIYDETVTYRCNEGFTIDKPIIYCQANGQWEVKPKCTVSSCPALSLSSNLNYTTINGEYAKYGSVLQFFCEPGYQIVGSLGVYCTTSGWSQPSPQCKEITCPIPKLTDGYINSNSVVLFGNRATLQCNPGYKVNGTIYVTQQLTCGADGTFRDPTGEKSELLCIDIDECKFGSNTCKTNQRCVNNLGSYTCSCRHGYKPDTDPNKDCININECEVNNGGCSQNCTDEIPGYSCTCQMGYELYMHDGFNNISLAKGENGKREGDVYYINHTCVRKQCPQPVSPENGFVLSQKQLFYYGDTVEYKCNHGYKMSFSNSIRTCGPNGQWDSLVPRCEVGSCQTQFQESDRNINRVLPGSGVTINYGEKSIIECSYGTKLINRTQYCGYTGSDTYGLLGDSSGCQVIDCGPPVVIPGSSFTFPVKTSFGEAFIFKCLDGFVEEGVSTLGSSIVKCEQNGRWGMGNLTCNGETCLDPGTPGGAKQVVTSYEEGKLLYFQCDRNGYMPVPPEPFLCHVDGGSIKWNSTELPICKDVTVPVFSNCPSNILYVDYMERINYNIPTATDNSGVIKKISVSPAYMKPNTVINNDTEITYYAEDYAGNIAMCLIQVKIKRRQVPTLQCASGPIAVEIWDIFFKNFIPQETLVNFVTPNFSLAISQIEPFTSLNEPPKEIRITAMDPYGTAMSCSILAFPLAFACFEEAFPTTAFSQRTCTSGRNNTLTCTVTCNTGYIFNDGKQTQKYQCEKANNSQSYQPIIWTPRSSPNDCLFYSDPAYTVEIEVIYSISGALAYQCASDHDTKLKSSEFRNALAAKLTEICSSILIVKDITVKDTVFTTFVGFTITSKLVSVIPSGNDKSKSTYCIQTIRFGLQFGSLKSYLGYNSTLNCAGTTAVANITAATFTDSGILCSSGTVEKTTDLGTKCVSCPLGTYFFNDLCVDCPEGQYQDIAGQLQCKTCVAGKSPSSDRTICIDICPEGFINDTQGQVPFCIPCPEDTYWLNATYCQTCPPGYRTFSTGAKNQSDCKAPCSKGYYSTTSHEPCEPCPLNYYQDHTGQNTCTACATNEITENTGSFDSSFCIDDSCRMVRESGNFFGTNGDEYVTKIVTSVEACERECMDDTRCKSAAFTGGVCILYSVNTVAVPYASASTLSRKVCGIDVSLGNGVCSVIGHIKVCTCNKGYKGDNCEIKDNPCDANPCFNGGTCIKTGLDTFNCSCPVDVSCRMIQESGNFLGTNGDEYVTKIVTSVAACEIECMDDTRCKSVAFTGGVCILYSVNTVAEPYAASTLSRKVCDITVLFTGDQCETDAVDSCINNTDCRSYGMCQDGLGTFVDGKIQEQSSFKCLCQQVGEFIDNRCNRKLDLCSPNPCENNGKCQSFGEIRRVCECLPGYTGENCSINIDECKIHPNGCLYGGMCNDGINAYTCTCKTGFSGDRCQIVPDICTLDPRCTNGLCYNNYDNYTAVCVCEKPYQLGSNGKCVLSDPCMGVTCINGSCMNGKCECQTGYEGSKCQHDIDDCKKGPCKNGAKCIDGYNSSQCICLQGYEGLFCEKDVDDCVDKCDNMTTVRCEDKVDDYECICMKGYTGKNCTEEIIECSSYPCRHGSECEDLHGDYKCNCTEGWTGKDCEIPVNYCQSNPCRNGGNCHNLIDGYFCNCMPGTRGETCSILPEVCRVVTPCTNSGACWDTDGTAVCNCTTNYTGNSCNLIKDSCKEDICKNGGTCKTKDLGFECICTPDYSGTTCEVYTDPCNGSSKCHNTAMCKSENDRYLCLCTEGRTLTADGCKDTYEDWDMFFDPKLGGHGAWSRTPFMLGTQELSIAFWTRFKVNNGEPEPTLLQLFSSSIANPLNFPTHGENFLKLVVLRITKDSVYMSNGTQETMIKIEDSISDGRWHHVAVTWKSVGQLYISVDGILQISSVGKSSRLPIYVQLLIGQNLNGRISRVTVWKTVLSFLDIVKASADPNHRLQGTLVQGWTNYMFSEGSERKYPSKVKQMVCDLGLEDAYCTNKYKEKPQIIRCPSDKEFLSSKRLTEIEDLLLNTDIVFNSSNHLHVWDNFPPDRYFGYGIKSYTAFAIDDYGNSAECTVRVVVKRAVSCIATAWNYKPPFYCDGMHGSICDVQCKNDTKLLSQPVPKIIKCGILGSYYTKSVCENKPYNLHVDDFVLPSCGELRQMKRRIEIKLQYRFQVGCTSSFLKSLQNDISTTFNSQLSEWTGICIFVNSVCETIAVTAICSSTQYMIADVMIKINDLSDIVSKNGVQYTPTEAFRVLVFIEHKFSFPNVGASVLVTDTVQIEELKYCEPGYAIVGQNCVQCPAGSYYDSSMDSCKFCGIGQYQNLSGQSSCRSCDGTKTTLQVGSSKSSDCVDKCLPGTYYDQGTHRCEQCPIHHYQDEEGKTYCLGCPVGKKTNGTGSNSPSDCLYESSQDGCVAGTELSPDRYCVSCPRGFYRSLAEDKCTKCPDNFTTPSSGADSHEFCHIRICYAGNFLNVTTNDCQPCPIGYYQPESLQDFCHSCDPSYSTKDEGNVNKTSCVFTPVTVCGPSSGNRTSLSLGNACGNYGNIGYCNSSKSACMPSASDTTWRCRCIVGYFRDFRQDDCVPAPMKLFNKEKITCDIGIGIRRGIEVCTANLTSTLSLYTTEIAQSMLRPQTDLFELKVDNSVTQFKLSTKVAITEVSTFVFVLHATLKVGDSIGSVNVSDVIEINLNFIQSDNLARKYFTYITEDTLPNQIVYRIPTENFKNPGSMIITGTNLFKLRSSSGIVHTDKFIGDELSSDEIGKEIIATIRNSRNGDIVAYLYVIIMRSEYKIELGEGIDPDRIIGTFSFISQNISITIDGVSNNIFYTTGLNLYRGNFEFDFDGDSNQREYNFNSKVNAPSYVTDSFNGELISKVVIRITDKNDQAPIFLKPTYEIPLLLSALSNVLIGFVTAEDNDTIGQLSYQIEQKYQSYFKINDIGAITTAVPVNALLNITGFNATTEILPIKVMATDGIQTATSTVLIQITSLPDENLGLTFKGYILEGEPIGTNITSIYESGYTNYQFIQVNEGEKYFKLNATSGNVKSNMEFDRETKDEIKIVVMATKEGALSCSISVLGELVVTVLDINDNAPVFTQSEYQGSVIENSADAVISMTVDVKATDADIDKNANVKYFLKNHQTVFNINETTAEIRTITGLDRESISEYILTVVATDGEKNGTADVVISVLDVNDNSPSFNTTYSLSVSEDTSIDTSVGKVTAADPDAGKNSKLVYYIIGGGGYFQIERYTGEIFVKHALDRETDTSFKFIVSARDDGDNPRSSAVNVTVTITDVNDNAPSFNESSLQTSLNEDVDCATSLHMVAAFDLDDGTNKEIQFQILSETDKFAINSTTGIITCKLGFKIDYENTTRYEISVEAKDKGNQPKSSTATVVIEINDVNDNDPVFIGDFAGGVKHISLSSAIFQGSVPKPILVIPVEDIDSGSNGAILLEVSGDFIGFVSTDSQTKLLQTKGGATPMTGEYTLNITAKDQGIPSRQTVASLIIEITSTVNIINKVTFTQENIRLEITEEQASLTYKYSNIPDFVINKNGKQMKYSILTAQDDFAINEAHGQLSVNKKLDRETKPGHFFVVRAENTMNSDDSDLGLIKITVVDINDNPPVFKKKKYIYLVEEDVNINYVLSSPKIEASDADDPGNTHFVFKIKITDDCAASFQINEQTGVISVQAELDYEKWSICRFDVELTDSQSSPINTASVEVDVNVLDVNDHSPEFDGSTFLYQVHVGEDAKIGDQIVSTARVTDADDRGNGDIILKMVDDVDCFFTVEKALEGEKTVPVLKVKTELDYEKNKSSTCIVIAEDKPGRKQDVRSASATFSISILDVNDNPPIVSSRPDEIEIERDIAPNTEILTHIAATDKDSGINAKLKYILDEILLREYFRINENTGAIATKYSLALLQKDVVKLHIKIEDSGTPTLSASLIVRIIIKDANFRPKFNSTRAAVSLKEEHEINGDIFIATAYDIVEGKVEKCNCTYRLQSGNEYFTIVNNTGIVRMLPNRVLDRENRKTILVLIIARDHDVQSPKDSEYLHLTVTVTDINDQSPVFNTDYAFNILQVAPVGTIIGKISADDKDEGINAVTYYSVENVTLPNEQPNDDSRRLIRIDIFNGTLFLNEVIDVNASHDFVIIVKVKAKDSLDDNKIGYTDVRLNVIFDNPNKHQPTCKNEFTRLNVLTAKENSTIVFLNASDSDTGINGEITFTIIDGNFRDIFSVDSRTGEMKLNYALNKAFVTTDVPDQFHIVIQVIDKGIVHKTGTCTISIEVDGDPEQCVEQSKLQEEQQIFIYSMSAIAVVLALFILLFLYCTYKYCTSKKYMHENDRSSPTIPYKPTFPDINKQNQFKQDFEPSNYTEDNISDIFGYEQPTTSAGQSIHIKSDEPIPDYDAEADNTSEEVDFEQLRKQERARSFKRSESSRKDRHKQIYGEDKDRKRPQDFLRNKKAKFMKKRNDDSFAFGGSDWDMSTKRFSNI